MTSEELDLREATMYSLRYLDRVGDEHRMTATYLGIHKFGGTSWSLRPLPGVKNLAQGAIVSREEVPSGTEPVPPHPVTESEDA